MILLIDYFAIHSSAIAIYPHLLLSNSKFQQIIQMKGWTGLEVANNLVICNNKIRIGQITWKTGPDVKF